MLFNSIDFLIFFPSVVLIYFVLPCRIRYLWLLAASYFFYMCWKPRYIVLIFLSTVITYVCGRIIGNIKSRTKLETGRQKRWMKLVIAVGFVSNIGMLVYFKYKNFLINSLSPVLEWFHINVAGGVISYCRQEYHSILSRRLAI